MKNQPTIRSRISTTLLVLAAMSGATIWRDAAADCNCGPTYCKNTPEFRQALAAKKASLANNYPARLVAILDKIANCQACVTQSPDGFSLFFVDKSGAKTIKGWDADNEAIGARQVKSGALQQCFVIYTRHAFQCCSDASYSERSDYVADLDLNTDMSVPCQ